LGAAGWRKGEGGREGEMKEGKGLRVNSGDTDEHAI